MKTIRVILVFLFLIFFLMQTIHAAGSGPVAMILTIDGAITPAVQGYLARGIMTAEQSNVQVIVLQLNTPGGGLGPMQSMTEAIRASRVPVVVYVTPRGAWAGSAGTIITLAGHAAAMAPETAIGAASPVGGQGENLGTTMQAKTTEIMKATVRSLAERRGPEAVALAESTIENAKAVSATEALKAHLVDFIASDIPDLVKQLDGFTVHMTNGPLVLHTSAAAQQTLPMSVIEQLLQFLVDPNIVFILLAIGVQAFLIELTHPGAWVPAFFAVACLSLAAYGLGFLPVNWFGLIFIVTAFVLFIVDIKAPTHGALTIAGVAAFIIGALVLFNSPGTPKFERVSFPLVIFVGIFIGLIFAVILGYALRAQRRPVITGMESLVSQTGIALSGLNPSGKVQAAGELWSAEAEDGSEEIQQGDKIKVVKVEGLRLIVRKKI
jgi:membrane-bound serine protease (ClpP class)